MSRNGNVQGALLSEDETRGAAPGSGLYGLDCPLEEAAVAVIPVPFEATVSYRPGTAGAPRAILDASRQVELFDVYYGTPARAGVAMLDPPVGVEALAREGRTLAEPIIQAGGVDPDDPAMVSDAARVDTICSAVHARVEETVTAQLDAGRIPGVLGGEHSVAFGAIAAVSSRWPDVGVLQIDAHADLRPGYEGFTWSHASVMHHVLAQLPRVRRLVQVGVRDLCEAEYRKMVSDPRIFPWFGARLEEQRMGGKRWTRLVQDIVSDLPDSVYVSFDIDGLDPSLCPATGTPVPAGLGFDEAAALLRAVVASGRTIVGFDLSEVVPGGHPHGWDAMVGARILYQLIGAALVSQGKVPPGPRLEFLPRPEEQVHSGRSHSMINTSGKEHDA